MSNEIIAETICGSNVWTIENKLSLVSLLFTLIAGVFACYQWHEMNRLRKSEFIDQILAKLRFDKEMANTMYVIDYKNGWYNDDFHNGNGDFEFRLDKLLSYLTYICYLYKERRIGKKEFLVLHYEINRVCSSKDVQSYLWNLYHFSKRQGTPCSFQYLIDYGIKNQLINRRAFLSSRISIYAQKLNF